MKYWIISQEEFGAVQNPYRDNFHLAVVWNVSKSAVLSKAKLVDLDERYCKYVNYLFDHKQGINEVITFSQFIMPQEEK